MGYSDERDCVVVRIVSSLVLLNRFLNRLLNRIVSSLGLLKQDKRYLKRGPSKEEEMVLHMFVFVSPIAGESVDNSTL